MSGPAQVHAHEPWDKPCDETCPGYRDFPFPLAEPQPPPVLITNPCGCTSMILDGQPVQVSWCVPHDPGYAPPGQTPPEDGR